MEFIGLEEQLKIPQHGFLFQVCNYNKKSHLHKKFGFFLQK